MPHLSKTLFMAKEMGEELARSEILQQKMQEPKKECK